jgi:hypothetical protein
MNRWRFRRRFQHQHRRHRGRHRAGPALGFAIDPALAALTAPTA